ncbi:protein of unknown function DUF627, N-terminal [Dillenia turbinata]|uniref:Uncharacterized protein n=1 Tax=Dillenia turbinata TaxID=194707 RepID=A0AAN8UIK5_9MAGN
MVKKKNVSTSQSKPSMPSPSRTKNSIPAGWKECDFIKAQESAKVFATIRHGNSTKALKLMKELMLKYGETSGEMFRIQSSVYHEIASSIAEPKLKQKHLRSALESARKAVELRPQSVESVHFLANLLYELAKNKDDYKEVIQVCEAGLSVEDPLDPCMFEEGDGELSSPESRIANMHNLLQSLIESAKIALSLNETGVEKPSVNPVKWAWVDDEIIKKRKETEARIAAQQELKENLFSTDPKIDHRLWKHTKNQRGENQCLEERKAKVRAYWDHMNVDERRRFLDGESYRDHVLDNHLMKLTPELLSWLPSRVGTRWTMMLQSCSWNPLDISAVVGIIKSRDVGRDPLAVESEFSWLEEGIVLDVRTASDCDEDENNCSLESTTVDQHMCLELEPWDQKWPVSDDAERAEILQRVGELFQLLLQHKCLTLTIVGLADSVSDDDSAAVGDHNNYELPDTDFFMSWLYGTLPISEQHKGWIHLIQSFINRRMKEKNRKINEESEHQLQSFLSVLMKRQEDVDATLASGKMELEVISSILKEADALMEKQLDDLMENQLSVENNENPMQEHLPVADDFYREAFLHEHAKINRKACLEDQADRHEAEKLGTLSLDIVKPSSPLTGDLFAQTCHINIALENPWDGPVSPKSLRTALSRFVEYYPSSSFSSSGCFSEKPENCALAHVSGVIDAVVLAPSSEWKSGTGKLKSQI